MVIFPQEDTNIEQYFIDQGLGFIVQESGGVEPGINDKLTLEAPYKPNLLDLYRLHRFIIDNIRTIAMAFGINWSILELAP